VIGALKIIVVSIYLICV